MHELTFIAPASIVEAVSDHLVDELAALSVSVEDADAGTDLERPLFGEPGSVIDDSAWQRSIVKALFADDAEATCAAAAVLADFATTGVQVLSIGAVDDIDWVRRSQALFVPSHIAGGFWVVPTWHEPPADATRVIRLDPGLAFGTGSHPTTRMCLRWIAGAAAGHPRWPRVLDYGCGSGILAIGASLFGAASVDAVDIDPAAVEATRANASANSIDLIAGLPELANGRYALVLANILATPLKLLAPLLCGHIETGGHLVLAGILERQTDELKAAYAPWLALEVSDLEDGWALMTGQRLADGPAASLDARPA